MERDGLELVPPSNLGDTILLRQCHGSFVCLLKRLGHLSYTSYWTELPKIRRRFTQTTRTVYTMPPNCAGRVIKEFAHLATSLAVTFK